MTGDTEVDLAARVRELEDKVKSLEVAHARTHAAFLAALAILRQPGFVPKWREALAVLQRHLEHPVLK